MICPSLGIPRESRLTQVGITPAFKKLRADVLKCGARLVVIDTLADIFGGNEIVRNEARQCINVLTGLAVEINGVVLLCAHPSENGQKSRNGTSGSTAWSNTVRSRIFLERPLKKKKKGEEAAGDPAYGPNIRFLSRKKANYSSIGTKLTIEWHGGAFKTEADAVGDTVRAAEREAANRKDDERFLACLNRLASGGVFVSASNQAGNYAPKHFAGEPEFKGIATNRAELAMNRLLAADKIETAEVGRTKDRKPRMALRAKEQALERKEKSAA